MSKENKTEIRPMEALPSGLFSAITNDSIKANERAETKESVLSLFRKHQYLWTDLKSPKSKDSTCTPDLWADIKKAIVLSWTDADQVIWNTPRKELSDGQQYYKRETLQQSRMGGRISDYCGALKKDQVPRKDPIKRTDIENILIKLGEVRILLQETEEEFSEDFDVTDATETIRLLEEEMLAKHS